MAHVAGIQAIMSEEHKNNISEAIKAYSKRLFSFINRRVNNAADAEDILQDVFYQFAGNTTPIEQIAAWLFRTARNKITDNYRKKRPELLDDVYLVDEEDEGISWQELLLSDDPDPEKAYLQNLFWTTLNAALDELPPEQKEAFVKHELEDISFEEIAGQSGVPIATLISRKRYAVLHLRRRLQQLKDELLNY